MGRHQDQLAHLLQTPPVSAPSARASCKHRTKCDCAESFARIQNSCGCKRHKCRKVCTHDSNKCTCEHLDPLVEATGVELTDGEESDREGESRYVHGRGVEDKWDPSNHAPQSELDENEAKRLTENERRRHHNDQNWDQQAQVLKQRYCTSQDFIEFQNEDSLMASAVSLQTAQEMADELARGTDLELGYATSLLTA